MKKILLILIILIINILPIFAESITNSISNIENNLFGYTYQAETDISRIERIESYLYGKAKTGDVTNRIKNINNDIGLMTAEEKIKQKEVIQENKIKQELLSAREDSSVEYPMIDRIETQLFNKTYKNENIYSRLNRLEEKVFNKTSNEPLNNRVDKLSSIIIPEQTVKQEQEMLTDIYSNPAMFPDMNPSNMQYQLAVLEQSILNASYDRDNIANRLNRLEQNLFKRNFQNDNDESRLQRIMVAYEAKKSSYAYENNKKMQKMATMSQLGGLLLMLLAILI